MGMFDRWKSNREMNEKKKELEKQEKELAIKEAEFQEQLSYMMELKTLLESLSDFEEKYTYLCEPLDSPRKEDGSVDYSKMGIAYRRHLLNFSETIFPSYNLFRVPSMIEEISENVKKDNRRLDKKDFLEVRKLINQQLDGLEALCSEGYDYKAIMHNVGDGFDNSMQEMKVG